MSTPLKKIGSTQGNKMKAMKLNNTIFSQLVAMLQSRPFSLQKMFNFELHSFPPAISDYGEINLPGNKSALVHEIVTDFNNSPESPGEYCPLRLLMGEEFLTNTQENPV